MVLVSGVIRCLRPLPWQETCGPVPRWSVGEGEPGQLGDPQPGLGGEGDHRVVAAAGPGGGVGGGEQRAEFRFGEPGDQGLVESLGRDGQDPGDRLGVLGMLQGGVGEHGVDRGEPGVAGARAVAADLLEVVQERADQRRVEVGEVELARLPAGAPGGEGEQQPPGVAVGGDGLRAGVPLAGQPVGEERLQGRGERGHGRCSGWSSSRCPAAASSSGAADRYQ